MGRQGQGTKAKCKEVEGNEREGMQRKAGEKRYKAAEEKGKRRQIIERRRIGWAQGEGREGKEIKENDGKKMVGKQSS